MLIVITIALLFVLGASIAVTRLISEFARFYERMNRYEALMDEADELEPNKEDEV